MSFSPDALTELSAAISARAEVAKNAVAAIRLGEDRHLSGMIWQTDVVVASEQSLPRKDEFELVMPGGSSLTAKLAGRDASTNIAILKTSGLMTAPAVAAADARMGTLALAFGATARAARARDSASSTSSAVNGIPAAAA